MKLDEMTPALRKAVIGALARDLAARQGVPERPRSSSKRRLATPRTRYRCARCGDISASWAACERHSDSTGHPRFEVVLEDERGSHGQ